MKKYIALFIIIILSLIFTVNKDISSLNTTQVKDDSKLEILIEGELENPGIFYIKKNETFASIQDQIIFTKHSDLSCIHQSRILLHEDKIFIPSIKEKKYSLNQGTIDDFINIKGIGPATASKIIEYRKNNPFLAIEEVMNISGIGEKTYLKIRAYLCL